MIPIISNLLNLPVTKKEVLKRVKKYKYFGLCYAINRVLSDYKIKFITLPSTFPLFNIEEAKRFEASCDGVGYWWTPGDWKSGRKNFLDWLIEQYKDDNENLRKLKL